MSSLFMLAELPHAIDAGKNVRRSNSLLARLPVRDSLVELAGNCPPAPTRSSNSKRTNPVFFPRIPSMDYSGDQPGVLSGHIALRIGLLLEHQLTKPAPHPRERIV
ncbi:hypothetical protein [Stenotrophomonas sp.]|uniref:hypothetical protein n=1 Tax=Stenotrophomonas sp. TaxID=69392 RepID=UPI0028AC5418|nr:hypothetical protein [Stenotrophomonas sp.]